MANPAHLDKLREGARAWNEWRNANPYEVPDLRDATLTLNQRQFGPADGGPIDLRAVNLEGAKLRFATLSGADLESASLRNADLMHARLDGAKLVATDLTDALLDLADFTGADLARATITGASLTNARNLTQKQIDLTFGDATTLLPAILTPPQSWFGPLGAEDIFPEYPALDDEEEEEDLYLVLGLTPTAAAEEIRAAHRTLVKKLHPDINPGDRAAQELFKKVSSAYHVLGDPERRARYDKGEIGADGRVRPEFEAQQEFRKYAFRYYAAAAMAALIALGALAFVWHQVLRVRGDAPRTATTVTKVTGRLASAPQEKTPANLSPSRAESTKLERPQEDTAPQTPMQQEPQTAQPIEPQPGAKAANLEPSPSSAGADNPSNVRRTAKRPLGKAHKKGQAGEGEAAPARSLTPESQEGAASPGTRQDRQTDRIGGPARQAVRVPVPKSGKDPVSSLFRARAVAQVVAKDPSQTTASIEADPLSRRRPAQMEAETADMAAGPATSSPRLVKHRRMSAFFERRARRHRRAMTASMAATFPPAETSSNEDFFQDLQETPVNLPADR